MMLSGFLEHSPRENRDDDEVVSGRKMPQIAVAACGGCFLCRLHSDQNNNRLGAGGQRQTQKHSRECQCDAKRRRDHRLSVGVVKIMRHVVNYAARSFGRWELYCVAYIQGVLC